jgi:hypothetical protein
MSGDPNIARTEEQDYLDEMREKAYAARIALQQGDEVMETQQLYEDGQKIAWESLPDRRKDLVDYIAARARAEEELSIAQAKAETVIVTGAGGEKALGANVEARKRALTIALSNDLAYTTALDTAHTLQRRVKETEMLVQNHRDQLSLIKAALYAKAGGFPG